MEITAESIAREIGLSKQTVRNWITQGLLAVSNRPGIGRALLLTKMDAIQLIVASEFSHLGVGPKIFSLYIAQIAYHVSSLIYSLRLISEAKAKNQQAWYVESKRQIPLDEFIHSGRYYILYYDESTLSLTQADNPTDNIDHAVDVTRIIIDTLGLAQKAMAIFSKIEHG